MMADNRTLKSVNIHLVSCTTTQTGFRFRVLYRCMVIILTTIAKGLKKEDVGYNWA